MNQFSEDELNILREGGKRLARVMRMVVEQVTPGVTTDALDAYARKEIEKMGDLPAFLGYRPHGAPRPYPGAICTSVNTEVVHGIPNEMPRTLSEGDIVTVDIGLVHGGLITDMAYTVGVGNISKENKELIKTAEGALEVAIAAARVGGTTKDIGSAVQTFVESKGFFVPHELGGHGVGRAVHEDPFIPNVGDMGTDDAFESGMVLAIEPIVMEKSGEVDVDADGYTIRSRDGGRSAQFEHTVLITSEGPEILTVE